MKLGIVGNGYVGGAVRVFMEAREEVRVFDSDPTRCTHSLEEVAESDLVFICLPTAHSGGGQNSTIVLDACVALDGLVSRRTPVIIKSTILPGTSREIQSFCPNLEVVFSPEFLTARTAERDFANPLKVVLGFGSTRGQDIVLHHQAWFPESELVLCSWEEAESLKYACNNFLATRVGFWNDFYDFCQAMGVDYDLVAGQAHDLIQLIAPEYCLVPGPDGQRGYGGACLPKDSWALMTLAGELGVEMSVLRSVIKSNIKRRPETDLS